MGECKDCEGRGFVISPDGGAGAAMPCECRKAQRQERLKDRMGIPEKYAKATFDNFRTSHKDAAAAASLAQAKAKCMRYLESFYDTGRTRNGLLLVGPPGVGKTHLACATLKGVVDEFGVEGRFVDFTSHLARLKATYNEGSEETTEQVNLSLRRPILLVLDELGAQKPTDHTMDALYLVLNHRYSKGLPTIFTSNYRLEGGSAALLENRLTPPLLSRLLEVAHVIQVDGWDYRRDVKRYGNAP